MQDTKEKILRTALLLFARDGYEAVSVSMIAGQLESAREEKEAAGGVYTLRTTAWCREMIARSEPAALYTEDASTYGTGH